MFPFLICSSVLVDRRIYPEPSDNVNVMNILSLQFDWLSDQDRASLLLNLLLEIDSESVTLLASAHAAGPFPTLAESAADFVASQHWRGLRNACTSLDPRQFVIPINRDWRLQEIKRKLTQYLPIAGKAMHRYICPPVQVVYNASFALVPAATWKFKLGAVKMWFELYNSGSRVVAIVQKSRRKISGKIYNRKLGVMHFQEEDIFIDFSRGVICTARGTLFRRAVWNFQVKATAFIDARGDLKLARNSGSVTNLRRAAGIQFISLTSSPSRELLYLIYLEGLVFYLEICPIVDGECTSFGLGSNFIEIDGDYIYVADSNDAIVALSFNQIPLHNSEYPRALSPSDIQLRQFAGAIVVADFTKPRLLGDFDDLCERYLMPAMRNVRAADFSEICIQTSAASRWRKIENFITGHPYSSSSIYLRVQSILAL